jgi:hypothetical protein
MDFSTEKPTTQFGRILFELRRPFRLASSAVKRLLDVFDVQCFRAVIESCCLRGRGRIRRRISCSGCYDRSDSELAKNVLDGIADEPMRSNMY